MATFTTNQTINFDTGPEILQRLTDKAPLKGKHFQVGKKANDGNDYVIYDDKSGRLWYDPDGRAALARN